MILDRHALSVKVVGLLKILQYQEYMKHCQQLISNRMGLY